MVRVIKALFVFSIGSWFSLSIVESAAAQPQPHQAIELPGEGLRIADFDLQDQVPSALDLVGPEHGSAGRNRATLAHRLQCWVDGIENCSAADPNDSRVRAIRRFLALGPADRDGAVTIAFGDGTQVEVRLVRAPKSAADTWAQSAYAPVVLQDTTRAPGLPAVPTHLRDFDDLVAEDAVSPAVRTALLRLKERLEARVEPLHAGSALDGTIRRPVLAQEPVL